MSTDTQEALVQLVQDTTLQSIQFHELHAAHKLDIAPGTDLEEDPRFEMHMQTRVDDGEIGVRVDLLVHTALGDIQVIAAADYINEGPKPSEEVEQRFATEVGVMALFPYLRQAVADLTQRVFGTSLLMPLIKREDLTSTKVDEGTPSALEAPSEQ